MDRIWQVALYYCIIILKMLAKSYIYLSAVITTLCLLMEASGNHEVSRSDLCIHYSNVQSLGRAFSQSGLGARILGHSET